MLELTGGKSILKFNFSNEKLTEYKLKFAKNFDRKNELTKKRREMKKQEIASDKRL